MALKEPVGTTDLTPRKYELKLYTIIKEIDPKAFIISYEPKAIHGGFWVKSVTERKIIQMSQKKTVWFEVAKETLKSV